MKYFNPPKISFDPLNLRKQNPYKQKELQFACNSSFCGEYRNDTLSIHYIFKH
jgi:hypothetical protein